MLKKLQNEVKQSIFLFDEVKKIRSAITAALAAIDAYGLPWNWNKEIR